MTDFLIDGKSLHDLTSTERRAQFLAWKQSLAQRPELDDQAPRWHDIDSPMAPEQYDKIPPGRPGICGRTPFLWVKYRHRDRRQVVIAKGVFDHETGEWLARYYPADKGDRVSRVEPIGWARIEPGVLPQDAPVIPSPLDGGL